MQFGNKLDLAEGKIIAKAAKKNTLPNAIRLQYAEADFPISITSLCCGT